MKKIWIIIFSIIIISIIAFFIFQFIPQSNNYNNAQSKYNTLRTTAYSNDITPNITHEIKETELYHFSTPIKSDSKNRLNNIKITCSRINETVVKAGKEFSFCDVVGQPSSDDGYKPADAYSADGEIIQAIGGGNCQVSTTLYNAVLKVKGLKVTERHEHDRDVAYIEDGKDATVAYDYLDLKFKNTNNFDIKLYAFVDEDKVTVKIFKIEQ